MQTSNLFLVVLALSFTTGRASAQSSRAISPAPSLALVSLSSDGAQGDAWTTRASVDFTGAQSNSYSFHAALSPDGRFVAFQSSAALVPEDDDSGFFDVYVHDLATGATEGITAADPTFKPNTAITRPSISADGLRVAFQAAVASQASLETSQVFLHDRASGVTTALSRRLAEPGNDDSTEAAISADGHVTVFESDASNLVPGDTNDAVDVLSHATGGG